MTQPQTLSRVDLERVILRVGLVASAILCWQAGSQVWEGGELVAQRRAIILLMVDFVAAVLFVLLAVQRRLPRRAAWVIGLVVPVVFASAYQSHVTSQAMAGHPVVTDVRLYADYAASLLRDGENPYAYDLSDAYRVYRASQRYQTPLIDGDQAGRLAYPALHVLMYVPFQVAGVSTALIYPLFWIGTLLLMLAGAPPSLRPLVMLPILAEQRYLLYSLGGVSDIAWAFMLCAMVVAWRRTRQRALWFGLACALKQLPILLAPYLLIRLWKEADGSRPRWRILAEFSAISAGVFLLFNAPFMVWDFGAWLRGIADPFVSRMIVLGAGLSSLELFGLVVIPKALYAGLMLAAWGVSLLVYWQYFDGLREALWIFPAVVLWFGHRSLSSYWYYFAIPLVLALVRSEDWLSLPDARRVALTRERALALAAVGVLLAAVVGIVVWRAVSPAPLSIRVEGPVYSRSVVYSMSVTVTNDSDRTLTPRFSVQSGPDQPFFWDVVRGPLQLSPGDSASYLITTDVPMEAFDPRRGAQVIVSDADGYDLRAAAIIAPALDARYHDAIPNGGFAFWDGDHNIPLYWGLIAEPYRDGLIRAAGTDDQPHAIRFTIPDASGSEWSRVLLDTWLPFPDAPVQVWVNPPADANRAPDFDVLYGLELESIDDRNRVWVLFGDEARTGEIEPGVPYWMVPAPRETWSQQTLDLRQIFADVGLAPSDPQRVVWQDTELAVSMLNFRLMFAARDTPGGPLMADFGPVRGTRDTPDFDALIRARVDQPEDFLIWRGDYNRQNRNYADALTYYRDALAADPSGRACYRLGETYWLMEDGGSADQAFQACIDAGYRVGDALAQQGWIAYYQGDVPRADSRFRAATLRGSAEGYNGLGYLALARDDCGAAVVYFNTALGIQPDLATAQSGLGVCRTSLTP